MRTSSRRLAYAINVAFIACILLSGCSAAGIGSYPSPAAGSAYAARPHATETIVYSFLGGNDGSEPSGRLLSLNGQLYGTTLSGGSAKCHCGTVYALNLSGQETELHSFKNVADGSEPDTGVVAFNGSLYGTTLRGGASAVGTVFKVSLSGHETVVHRFPGAAGGAIPSSGLTLLNGALYGETGGGGKGNCGVVFTGGCGTIFKVAASGQTSVVYAFKGGTDGGQPRGGLLAYNGNLYGTTGVGGYLKCIHNVTGCGTVFKVTPSGVKTTLHAFRGRPVSDGSSPSSGVAELNGAFYGATDTGGSPTCGGPHHQGGGTLFSMTTSGHVTVLHTFNGPAQNDGELANGLTALNGNLYGTTEFGGTGGGILFELTQSGAYTIVYDFTDPAHLFEPTPSDALIAVNGTLYGTTAASGTAEKGTVFAIVP